MEITPPRPDNKKGINRAFKERNGRKPTDVEKKYREKYGKFPTSNELKQILSRQKYYGKI